MIKQNVYLLVYHKYVKTLTNYMNSGYIKLSPICRIVTEVSTVCIIAIFIFATCCTLMEPVTYIIFEVFRLTCINKKGWLTPPSFKDVDLSTRYLRNFEQKNISRKNIKYQNIAWNLITESRLIIQNKKYIF